MSGISGNKTILLLSDNESVAKIIESIQAPDLSIVRFMLKSPEQQEVSIQAGSYDLVILALSVYENEPIVALARTSLVSLVGRMPILIISDKEFQSDPATLITHVNLRFSIKQLNIQVRSILGLQVLECPNR